ncbi:hypothetical protein [Leptolyngbya ohadii]|uniref:hypothetical protein n=1 Tax=Leptolyngbya ohadii TaxID=1962290 RepID=UPI000B599592|nr:hypothetical protein [Leptolyngbya ohadii]
MTSDQSKYAIGIFPSREITEQAIEELKASGFPMNRVSVLLKDSENAEQTSHEGAKEKTPTRSERIKSNAVQSAARLEAACHRANVFGMVSLRRIRSMLQTQLDKEPLPEEDAMIPVVDHANARGAQYYS